MTPEILNESNALIIKIKAAMDPIDEAKNNPGVLRALNS